MNKRNTYFILFVLLLCSCAGGSARKAADEPKEGTLVDITFCADSAYSYIVKQCSLGPRTMNSSAHDRCGEWIASKFRSFGLSVSIQEATLKGYDGTSLKAANIIASYLPGASERVLLCAHWDSRPWADNDPDENKWRTPIDAANDGASGVAVMLELARQITADTSNGGDSATVLGYGIDFICFDAEDYGIPRWEYRYDDSNTWALGSAYWAERAHEDGYTAGYGVLLDMVGGQGARFYREVFSEEYAPDIVEMVWRAASVAGYSSFFPHAEGGAVMDDHVNINSLAGIPTIDIIPYYPDCSASSFGPTWHTVSDDVSHIDKNTLCAVGQTLIQVLFTSSPK